MWPFSSSPTPAQPASQSTSSSLESPTNLASSLKPANDTDSSNRPKPCCVCKDEKSERDKCMLFSQADDPQEDCKGMVQKYRECMKGYGFNVA